MKNLRAIAKKSVLWLVAAALLVTVTVVLWKPAPNADSTQTDAAGNESIVSGNGVLVDNTQDDAGQLPEEHPDETVSINQGTNADPENRNVLPIKQLLTWEAINSFPIKYPDMPIAERRQLCVDFFNFSKTALWTPKEDTTFYISGSNSQTYTLKKGAIYGGLPYMTVSSGNVYRMMDFIDESTGVIDAHKYMTEAPDAAGVYSNKAMRLFGGQCSYNSYWGWARVINSAKFGTTYYGVPTRGFLMDKGYPSYVQTIGGWKATSDGGAHPDNTYDKNGNLLVNTVNVCNKMGEQEMYKMYKNLRLGDGLVYVTSAGHFMMCTADAYVVYNSDGTINGTESYILVSEQTGTWVGGISPMGDWYEYEEGVNTKKSFKTLFEDDYLTFTFKEFETKADGTPAHKLEETWVSFSYTGNTITKSQLFASSVSSNYAIADTYVIVADAQGKEVYRHIVRANEPSITTMQIVEKEIKLSDKTMLNVVDTLGTLTPGTYNIEIQVQLGTGERPTVYTGTLKV